MGVDAFALLFEGDDCISIVNGSKNIEAIDVTCGPGHGIRSTSQFFSFSTFYLSNPNPNPNPQCLFGSCFLKLFSVLKNNNNKENRENTFTSHFFFSRKH